MRTGFVFWCVRDTFLTRLISRDLVNLKSFIQTLPICEGKPELILGEDRLEFLCWQQSSFIVRIRFCIQPCGRGNRIRSRYRRKMNLNSSTSVDCAHRFAPLRLELWSKESFQLRRTSVGHDGEAERALFLSNDINLVCSTLWYTKKHCWLAIKS